MGRALSLELDGDKVRGLVESAEQAYTPDSVLTELARKYFREGANEKLVRGRLTAVQGTSQVVPMTPDLAVYASRAYLDLV